MMGIGWQESVVLGVVAVAIFLLLPWVLLSVAAGFYAQRLHRSLGWVITALLFSPLVAFAMLFGLGEKTDEERVPCPYCAEGIKAEASRCSYCQSDLTRDSRARELPNRYAS